MACRLPHVYHFLYTPQIDTPRCHAIDYAIADADIAATYLPLSMPLMHFTLLNIIFAITLLDWHCFILHFAVIYHWH